MFILNQTARLVEKQFLFKNMTTQYTQKENLDKVYKNSSLHVCTECYKLSSQYYCSNKYEENLVNHLTNFELAHT